MDTCQRNDLPITSLNALRSTIRTDKQVRRWFMLLIQKKEIEVELSGKKDSQIAYKSFKNILYLDRAMFGFLFGIFLSVAITRQFQYSFVLILLLAISLLLKEIKKRKGVNICEFLIRKDFDTAGFSQKTLYQIGEFYSCKYRVISLVDAITFVDAVTRRAVFYTIIFVTFIYPLNFWQACSSVLASYYIFNRLLSTAFIYQRIK